MQEKSMSVRPPERAHPSTLSSPRSGKQSMPKGSILVVDDESEIREGLELLLTSEGYGVSSAGTAESGLAKLEERPYDLLLLDVSLPDRNGLDLFIYFNHPAPPHIYTLSLHDALPISARPRTGCP